MLRWDKWLAGNTAASGTALAFPAWARNPLTQPRLLTSPHAEHHTRLRQAVWDSVLLPSGGHMYPPFLDRLLASTTRDLPNVTHISTLHTLHARLQPSPWICTPLGRPSHTHLHRILRSGFSNAPALFYPFSPLEAFFPGPWSIRVSSAPYHTTHVS